MGVYGNNSCKKNNIIYPIMYFISALFLIILGILFETGTIANKYIKKSDWKHGVIGLGITGILLIILNIIFKSSNISLDAQSYVWYLSHILCYFAITFVSPAEWPFWLAIGILWELFECYGPMCKIMVPISCSGFYDITANIAGIALAMWLRSSFS